MRSFLLFTVLLTACVNNDWANPAGDDAGSGNQNDASDTPDEDATVNDGDTPPREDADVGDLVDGDICGEQTEEVRLINLGDPPDLLIVLDRSSSMLVPPNLVGASKWRIMKDALNTVLYARELNIRFGFTAFPTDSTCGIASGVEIPIDLENASAISEWLDSHGPVGATPAHLALHEAAEFYRTIPRNEAGRYVLFATDGMPNCGGSPPDQEVETGAEVVAEVEALAAEGIHTFVLGFGGLMGLPTPVLNQSAQAGLEPRPDGPPYFYHANDAVSLQEALDTIAGGIIRPTCVYQLEEAPPDLENVTVLVNGEAVPRTMSNTDGWNYHPDDSTITFFGSYCDDITSGDVTSVNFLFGCPGPVLY